MCTFTDEETLKDSQNPFIFLFVMASVGSFAILCCVICFHEKMREHPTNLIALFTFTICEAYVVGF